MSDLPHFPVSIPGDWYEISQLTIDDAYLSNWLLDTGSLTERLQSQCAKFHLSVIGQRQMSPELEELSQFSTNAQSATAHTWQIREVILYGNGEPWVFARSVLPQKLCDMDLSDLGERPLGQIIFNDPRFRRNPFQLWRLDKPQPFLQAFDIHREASLFGRRSVFSFNALQLMVAEVFLPACPAYRQLRTL